MSVKALDPASPDIEHTHSMLVFLRKSLANGTAQLNVLATNSGLVPKLYSLLDSPTKSIVLETAWIITNLAASEGIYVKALRTSGIDVKLIKLFMKGDLEIKEQVCVNGYLVYYTTKIVSVGIRKYYRR